MPDSDRSESSSSDEQGCKDQCSGLLHVLEKVTGVTSLPVPPAYAFTTSAINE